MLKLIAVQAHHGDSLILKYGRIGAEKHLLIDGGPKKTWDPFLKNVLAAIGGRLEAVCLSHVDEDHVYGLLDLFAAVRDARDEGTAPPVELGALWLNQFSATVDAAGVIAPRLANVMQMMGAQGVQLANAGAAFASIGQGDRLTTLAQQLGIAVNGPAAGKQFLAGKVAPFDFGSLRFTVVGPTKRTLDALKDEWLAWLTTQEDRVGRGAFKLAAMADESTPNLSSIQLLVEDGGKRLLLTGDGRGDHLLDGLEEAGLLDANGGIDVDVLKLPHHGSDRNVDEAFFERVRAKTYVISADGLHGNPDYATLQWLVSAASGQRRPIEIVLTNSTKTVEKFKRDWPEATYGYTIRTRAADADSVEVTVAN